MKIRCLGQRVVVKRIAPEERRGIIIAKDTQKRSTVGVVVDKGPDATWVEVGEYVHFAKYSGTIVTIDDEYIGDEYDECLYMNCEDIISVLEGTPNTAAQPEKEVARV